MDKGGKDDGAKIARDEEDARFGNNIQSGTLTAGSFDDNLNSWVFDRFLTQIGRASCRERV